MRDTGRNKLMRYANARSIGPLTIYKKGRGPLLSIEVFSHSSGTTIDTTILERQATLILPLFKVPSYKGRIAARRYYR